MTRRFGGFLTSEEPSLQIPRVFIAEVLPQIADMVELKVTLCLFDLLAEAGGYDAPLAEETIYRHPALRASLKRLGSPKEPDESINRGLELAVSRGTMLRFMARSGDEGANERGGSWYLLNTPRNREALGKMVARRHCAAAAALAAGYPAPDHRAGAAECLPALRAERRLADADHRRPVDRGDRALPARLDRRGVQRSGQLQQAQLALYSGDPGKVGHRWPEGCR